MFNAERLLGKMLTGAAGSGSRSLSRGIGSSLVSELTSGAGLMTIIGLGVGAYEIMKDRNTNTAGAPGMPPPVSSAGASMPPPPPAAKAQATAPPPQIPTPPPGPETGVESKLTPPAGLDGAGLAMRMIQAMIAAAAADCRIDAQEETKILEKLQEQALTQEEKQVFLQELHNPKEIAEFTAGISDPAIAQAMYSIASAAITIDTEAERLWLDELAGALHITPAMQRFLEDTPE